MKERSVSQSRLVLLSPLVEAKNTSKSPMGSEIITKSGNSTPRQLPPIDDLQAYFKQIEDQEEKLIIKVLKEIDSHGKEVFSKLS